MIRMYESFPPAFSLHEKNIQILRLPKSIAVDFISISGNFVSENNLSLCYDYP